MGARVFLHTQERTGKEVMIWATHLEKTTHRGNQILDPLVAGKELVFWSNTLAKGRNYIIIII